jgi:hypothetical protein
VSVVTVTAFAGFLLQESALAQYTPPKVGRFEQYFGLVKLVPPRKLGTWVIGTRTLSSDPYTQVEEFDALLTPGTCALVEVRRGGHVIRIVALRDMTPCGNGERPRPS